MTYYNEIYFPEASGEWKENRNGNFVFISRGRIAATVFNPPKAEAGVWCIIINRASGGHIVQDECYYDVDEAQERAEAIVDGAPAKLKLMRDRGV